VWTVWTIRKVNFIRQHVENVFLAQRECKILPKAKQYRTRVERKKVDKGHIAVFVALNRDFFGDGKFAVSPSVDT
jgi:hypothetical protein